MVHVLPTTQLVVFVLTVLLCASNAVSTEIPITIMETEGSLELAFFGDASPAPAFTENWRHEVGDGAAFHAEVFPSEASWLGGYLVHCDVDGMFCHGSWTDRDPDPVMFNWVSVYAEMTCLVQVDEQVGLVADRGSSGPLTIGWQEVFVTHSDETTVEILGSGVAVDHVEMVLEPGQYRITIRNWAWEQAVQSDCESSVRVQLVDPVTEVEEASWAGVRALYR